MTVFYFGCMGEAGHYFFNRDTRYSRSIDAIGPWGYSVDGKLQPSGSQAEGQALLHHKGDWTALAFWDRSVDERPGSCSVFLADAKLDFGQMLEAAKAAFPSVLARYRFPVVLVIKGADVG